MRYLVLLLLIPLAGCATLSEDQCRQGDWQAIGRADGAEGRTPDYLEKHAKACDDYGIQPDAARWEQGRQQGLPLYCRPASAWDEGADGHRLSPVCPVAGLDALERANRRGLTFHRIGQDIEEAEREIGRINSRIASLTPEDPDRVFLYNERAMLRLEIVSLRAERALYRF